VIRLLLGALVASVLAAWLAFRVIEVEGLSMTPTLLPGDRLLVLWFSPLITPAMQSLPEGSVVVARLHDLSGRLIVKRVVSTTGSRCLLVGDASPTGAEPIECSRRSVRGRVVGVLPRAASYPSVLLTREVHGDWRR
jgi:phage repressor protein C with HTH and peptisase S24 domain